jgi:hypothetical protein
MPSANNFFTGEERDIRKSEEQSSRQSLQIFQDLRQQRLQLERNKLKTRVHSLKTLQDAAKSYSEYRSHNVVVVQFNQCRIDSVHRDLAHDEELAASYTRWRQIYDRVEQKYNKGYAQYEKEFNARKTELEIGTPEPRRITWLQSSPYWTR